MLFSDIKLSKQLNNALSEQGIEVPTLIQERAIPVILSGKDVVGIAQTGTGKTLAYLLPILRDLKYANQRPPRVLILVPTRELVVQVASEIEKLTQYLSVRTISIYGGTNINTQKQAVYDGCDIIVATPGRLYDLAMTGVLRLKEIHKLVIDECDELLNLGFRPQLERIIELLPTKRQNLMFSATITEHVDNLVNTYFNHTEKIVASPTGTPLKQIEQQAFCVPNYHTKLNFLIYLLKNNNDVNKIFIFVKTKIMADRLYDAIDKEFPEVFGVLHSNKSQNYRLRMVDAFKTEKLRGLIATDLVSRGIDVSNISHVINFDLPDQDEQYIHRIGRTGRVDQKGKAISFVTDNDLPFFKTILNYMQINLDLLPLPKEVEVSNVLLPEEEDIDIHDAPTIIDSKHSVGEGEKNMTSKKIKKSVNLKPREKSKKKSFKKRKKKK